MVILNEVERRGLLSENQLGTVRRVQDAKEQVFINLAINKHNMDNLNPSWINVKKAFNSVDQNYLIEFISKLNLSTWVNDFIHTITSHWKLSIRSNGKEILEKKNHERNTTR
ncbi:hypothetical protein NGRA_2332 [Nosema granulosis]|uniref:Reverse transcriptase domain-containing protein n=1 Tax=Nosema granulosis TaxID=83296 RepID=A0A9P6GYC1_9MICR|nr:hypothetical protein NGRA_2332 [Nosema granulosis]